jgi:hypothetical protein
MPPGGDAVEGDPTAASATAFSADATVAPAQLRSDQIDNAVSFLSHPKVRRRHRAAVVSAHVSVSHACLDSRLLVPARTPGVRKAVDPACPLTQQQQCNLAGAWIWRGCKAGVPGEEGPHCSRGRRSLQACPTRGPICTSCCCCNQQHTHCGCQQPRHIHAAPTGHAGPATWATGAFTGAGACTANAHDAAPAAPNALVTGKRPCAWDGTSNLTLSSCARVHG